MPSKPINRRGSGTSTPAIKYVIRYADGQYKSGTGVRHRTPRLPLSKTYNGAARANLALSKINEPAEILKLSDALLLEKRVREGASSQCATEYFSTSTERQPTDRQPTEQ